MPCMWMDPAHLSGTGERGRAGQPGIENGDANGIVGVQLVVVIGEGEWRARLEGFRHVQVDAGEPIREMCEAA